MWSGKLVEVELAELLAESSVGAFEVSSEEIGWRDRTLSLAEIERARRSFFHSVGSCSFDEPVDDLSSLELLH